eukprot:comp18981_c0_seq1/m.21304 comp18981_c0_seq1/g.21304  ORF comp18981_c0_seq1/g.21304 comp18981_c0_seq1/m.21304 type:complete len:406 (-) comp18981_c0_seq1:219-1436(-)
MGFIGETLKPVNRGGTSMGLPGTRYYGKLLVVIAGFLALHFFLVTINPPECTVSVRESSAPSYPLHRNDDDVRLDNQPQVTGRLVGSGAPAPIWRPRVRIAYLVSAQDENTIRGVEEQIRLLYHPDHTFVVHLDKKTKSELAQAFWDQYGKVSNVHRIDAIDVKWAGYSIVQMHMAQLRKAQQIGKYDVAINICGATVPIKSNRAIDQYLWDNVAGPNGSSLVSFESTVHACHPNAPHNHVCRRSGGGEPDEQCIGRDCAQVKNTPGHRPWYKGWAWFAIKPDFVQYALDSAEALEWQKFFQGGFIMSDESYFQTVFFYSKYFKKYDEQDVWKTNPMYVDWRSNCLTHRNKRPVVSPCYLGINDFGQLRIAPHIFARKISWDDQLITWLKELNNDPLAPIVPVPI